MVETLIILAGGISSRMRRSRAAAELAGGDVDQANKMDKGLIGVGEAGRPLMDYLLNNALHAGYSKVIIVTGEQSAALRAFYGTKDAGNEFRGLEISYAVQRIPEGRIKPWGTADALLQALEQFPFLQKDVFTVCNSDNLYSKAVLKALRENTAANAWIDYDRDGLELASSKILGFAVTHSDQDHRLLEIIEKPAPEQVEAYRDASGAVRVSMNIFKFSGVMIYPELVGCRITPIREEKELPTAILAMVKKYPGCMQGIPMSEHVPDLTEKDDIIKVRQFLKEKYPQLNWEK